MSVDHTEYSLLDGCARISGLVAKAKSEGARAVAITDHGNMYGAIKFYKECKAKGIKPIIGMEAYFCENMQEKNSTSLFRARNGHDGYGMCHAPRSRERSP